MNHDYWENRISEYESQIAEEKAKRNATDDKLEKLHITEKIEHLYMEINIINEHLM